MKRIIVVIAVVLFAGMGNSCFSQDQKDTLKVLFVGNSYTYYENLPQMVSLISERTKTKLITRKSTIGGAKLSEHWFGERGLKTKEIIEQGHFDIVVLQDYSLSAVEVPDSLRKYGKLFCDFVKANGAKPYLYLTWAREKVPQYQEAISQIYTEVAKENDAVAVPVGEAWKLARTLRPANEFFLPDGSHPSALGTFLTACVFTSAITGELPEELPRSYNIRDLDGESLVLMILDAPDVVFCREIAAEIVLNE